MSVKSLKFIALIVHTVLVSVIVNAQAYRFVYIQTENNQPFYAKLGKSTFNSSRSGYMIIPKLADTAYNCVIGFSNEKTVAYQFSITAGTANAGFLLKKVINNELAIYNLQSLQPVPVLRIKLQVPEDTIVFIDNEFARVLASVVNDPSIAQVTVKRKMEKAATPAEDSLALKEKLAAKSGSSSDTDSVSNSIGVNASTEITILKQEKLDGGTQMTYVDRQKTGSDTIQLYLPVKQTSIEQEKEKAKGDTIAGKTIELTAPQKETAVVKSVESSAVVGKPETSGGIGMINSDCKKIASEKEFLSLRKSMASKTDEQEMLKLATRQFIKTCFTTEHIKGLSVLLVKEENKYKFFVSAFPFVSDTHNFSVLEDQLTDSYYKSRFKAMLLK